MRYKIATLIILFSIFGCKSPEARKPVTVKTGSFIKASAERNINLNDKEALLIKAELNKNPNKTIIASSYGFWYFFTDKTITKDYKPQFGDLINFDYNVKNLNGTVIYTKEAIKNQNYIMDKAELFTGLREALKLLSEGQSATFFFPSQKAYGYYGDENKIGTSVPIRCEVKINSITKTQQ